MGDNNSQAFTGKMEEFRALITLGQAAVRYQIIINGGACVALLAFIGGIFDKDELVARSLSTALLYFGLGVIAGGLVAGFGWIGQRSFYNFREQDGERWNRICIIFGITSYICFITGGFTTYLILR